MSHTSPRPPKADGSKSRSINPPNRDASRANWMISTLTELSAVKIFLGITLQLLIFFSPAGNLSYQVPQEDRGTFTRKSASQVAAGMCQNTKLIFLVWYNIRNTDLRVSTVFECAVRQGLSTVKGLCRHHPRSERFHLPKWKARMSDNRSPVLHPCSLASTILLSVSLRLAGRGTSQEWNHLVFFCDWLISLGICFQCSATLFHVSEFPSFFRLNNILLFLLCLIIHLSIETWIASTFGAIMNKAVVNMAVIDTWFSPCFGLSQAYTKSRIAELFDDSLTFMRNHYSRHTSLMGLHSFQ